MKFISQSNKFLIHFEYHPDTNVKLELSRFLDAIPTNQHAEISRTIYGVLRHAIALHEILHQYSTIQTCKLHPSVHGTLRIALFLIFYSNSYPDYAVVNEAVKQCPKPFKSFVNGFLRNVLRHRESIQTSIILSDNLTIKYSISPLLIEHLQHISTDIEHDLNYLNREPIFHLHLSSQDSIKTETLQDIPIDSNLLISHLSVIQVKKITPKIQQNLVNNIYYIQNTGSWLISAIAAAYAKGCVLDVAAAPGTKSLTLSNMRTDLSIFANDINWSRLKMVNRTIKQLHKKHIHLVNADASLLPFSASVFDLIIIDAPCTSSGTLRKNPDLKSKISLETIQKNQNNQMKIVRHVAENHPNCFILYAVCSYIANETEHILEALNHDHPLIITDLSEILDEYQCKFFKSNFGYYLLPNEQLNNDIFYFSLFRVNPR